MNVAWVQNMVHRPRVLRGGKAPRYWKRELSRLTEALASMPRRGDWIAEIAETHPRLLSEPLLGTCLTAVTHRIARSESNEETPADRLTSPHLPSKRHKEAAFEQTASSKRRQISSPVFRNEKSENKRHSEVASQLPRRASDSLLRLRVPDALHVAENLIGATSTLPRRTDSPPVNSPVKITRLEWLSLVADRAAKTWINHSFLPRTHKSSSSAVAGNRSKRSHSSTSTQSHESNALATESPASVETSVFPSLYNDWLLPIAGQQASPQLLASLMKHPPSPGERGAAKKIHRNETFTRSNSESHSLRPSPDSTATESRTFAPDISPPLGRMVERQSPALLADSDRSLALPLESAINSEEREQRASPNLAPTVLTPALSPLLPPASAGRQVLPIAADTARRIAWRDEVDAQQTDLSVLAAQVKRILDEEARRHGIDV